jgi:ATP-dependent RNA helicase DeaD
VDVGSPNEAHADIEYRVMIVAPREREFAVVNLLRVTDASRALVFCATRDGVGLLARNLAERGFAAVALSGELSQNERSRALQALRDGRARVCIATDVAARGLDLPDLGLVIHADPPSDAQVLRHRSGRTGRAGNKGMAVVIVPPRRIGFSQRIFALAKIRPKLMPPPSAEQVVARDQERLLTQIAEVASAEASEDDLAVADGLLAAHDARALVAALVATERRRLPAPEDLPETTSGGRVGRTPREPGRRDEQVTGVWFRVNVGERQEANPRWLLPMLCRRGGVTKHSIGKIVVGEHESRFEVHPGAADAFEEAASKADRKNPGVAIERLGGT